jgi:hypothetical protein
MKQTSAQPARPAPAGHPPETPKAILRMETIVSDRRLQVDVELRHPR